MKSLRQPPIEQPRPISFPALLRYKGPSWTSDGKSKLDFVVLFSNNIKGTVVDPGNSYHKLGEHENNWVDANNPETWTEFTGEITLEND